MSYFLVSLLVYWVLWRIWCAVVPNLINVNEYSNDTITVFAKPKFWQFFIVVFLISFIFRSNNANH